MFFHFETRKISLICKISAFFEDVSFLNPRSHLKHLNFFVQIKEKYQATVFFKFMRYGYETFQNVKPALLNQIAKTSNLELSSKPPLGNLF